jgi:hypothetical protein
MATHNPDGRRIGKFRISSDLLRHDFRPELQAVMARVFVLHAEHLYAEDCFQYIALSDRFDAIPPGSVVPEYRVIVELRRYMLMGIENYCVRFERVPDGVFAGVLSADWDAG